MTASVTIFRIVAVLCFSAVVTGQLTLSRRHLSTSTRDSREPQQTALIQKYESVYKKIKVPENSATYSEQRSFPSVGKEQRADQTKPKDFISMLIQGILGALIPVTGKVVNEECRNHSLIYMEEIFKMTPWALQMLDATGKLPDGILIGNVHPLGQFNECLDIGVSLNITEIEAQFSGKYCYAFLLRQPSVNESRGHELLRAAAAAQLQAATAAQLRAAAAAQLRTAATSGEPAHPEKLLTMPSLNVLSPQVLADMIAQSFPRVGFCIPSSCTEEDLSTALADVLSPLNTDNYTFIGLVPDGFCYTKEGVDNVHFKTADIIVMLLYCLLICLAAVGTTVDVTQGYRPHLFPTEGSLSGTVTNVLKSFSVLANGKKLFSTNKSAGTLECVHGLRFISMSWVILGHTWFTGSFLPVTNPLSIVAMSESWSMQVILNGTVSVDTFFLLSGFLVSYLMLKELSKSKRINPLLLYLHRYIRLTPAYALFLGFLATWARYLASGPFWHTVEALSENCRKNWWTNLLYINNFVHQPEACMGEMWYLACDMHLFLISPLVIYPLWRWKRLGLAWFSTLTIVSLAIPGILIYVHDYPPTSLIFHASDQYQADFYSKTYCRASPYFVGIFLGYVLHHTRDKPVKIRKTLVAMAWLTATAVALSIVYGLYDYNQVKYVPTSMALSIIYGTFHRFLWSLCVSWVIFACIKGYGGFVNSLLSWGAFMPLSRLTYCSYVIHLELQLIFISMISFTVMYSWYLVVYFFFGHMVITTAIAVVLSLLVEAPFINLEKILFRTKAKADGPSNAPFPAAKDRQEVGSEPREITVSVLPQPGGAYLNEGFVTDPEKRESDCHPRSSPNTHYEVLDGKSVPRTEL